MSVFDVSHQKRTRLSRVVNEVFRGRNNTRYAIGNVLGLSQSAVVEYTKALIEGDVILEKGLDSSSGGRPSVHLGINPDYRHAVAHRRSR